jgi:hypothetical protein
MKPMLLTVAVEPMPVLPSYPYEFPYNKSCSFEYRVAPKDKYHISLFYHVGMLGNWIHVIHDQLDTLERCGLGYMAQDLTISVNTEAPQTAFDDIGRILNKYNFTHSLQSIHYLRSEYPETYEWSIMQNMRDFCLQRTNSTIPHILYYFHTKGVGKFEPDWKPNGDDLYFKSLLWRKYMEFFQIERPTLCLGALLYHDARACGVQAQEWPTLHYSGNFWSATCEWIRQLNNVKPEGPILTYVGAEMWIGNQSSWATINTTQYLNLFSFPVELLSEIPIYPKDYENIVGNKSLWPDKQVSIWEDYVNKLNDVDST